MNKSEHISKNLTAGKMRAIISLLEGESIAGAAKKARVSRTVLYQWLKNPEFLAILNENRERIFAEAISKLKAAASMAVDRLIEIVKSDNENEARLSSLGIVKFALKGSEYKDLEERIEKIEKILEERMPYVS